MQHTDSLTTFTLSFRALFHHFRSLFEKATCMRNIEKRKGRDKNRCHVTLILSKVVLLSYSWQLAKNGGTLSRVTYKE